MFKKLCSILAACCVIAVFASSPAFATIINYGTDGLLGGGDDTILFYDDFESQPTANVSHNAYGVDTILDAKPTGGSYGSWVVSGSMPLKDCQVTDYALPGAYLGDNYLRVRRSYTSTFTYVGEVFDLQDNDGDVIHFDQMFYVEDNVTDGMLTIAGFGNADLLTDRSFHVKTMADGSIGYLSSDSGFQPISGITWTADAWQKWEIDYAVGASTFALMIDGTTVSGIPVYSAENLTGLRFASGFNGSETTRFYLDEVAAVPEPSTFALLAAGLVGLLAYAWRKRK